MNLVQQQILQQVFYYFLLMVLTIGIISFTLKGFFWKYLKVRMSFGKYVLVKIRSVLRDYYAVGWVDEGFLVYKYKKNTEPKRIALNSTDKIFYRSLFVNWVDVDEEKNALCKTDYTTIPGFDSIKFSDLLKRALMKPSVNDNFQKMLLGALIVLIIVALGCAYLSYLSYTNTQTILTQMPNWVAQIKSSAVVTGGTTI